MVLMTKLKVNIVETLPSLSKTTALLLGIQKGPRGIQLAKSTFDSKVLGDINFESLGLSSDLGKIGKISGPEGSVLVLVGLGEKLEVDSLRLAAGAAARESLSLENLIIDLPLKDVSQVSAVIEGASLGHYEFNNYKPKAQSAKLGRLTVVSPHKPDKTVLAEIETISLAVKNTRNLVNLPANDLYPQQVVAEARKLSKSLPVKLKVWEEKDLISQGLGGIHAVGRGSARPPRLLKVEYRPAKAKTSVSLVGKGITFDTGGLSLKPAEAMVGMKYDMTGAAVVLNAVLAIARLALPVRATAWLCLAENMPSGSATRPNDVIKIRNGKTVEVLNTDAEGRLVLADGLAMASEEKPDYLIDVATLTGAATIALGNRYAGLMGDAGAVKIIEQAANTAGELVWHMPLPEELRSLLNSDIADIANVKIGSRAGGMLIGGLFLREFVGATDGHKPTWAHLDIAGPANNEGAPYGFTPKGATGVMVRTLVQLAKDLAN